MNENKGDIKYWDRFSQLISFEGIKLRRKIRPTDIDLFIDYGGKSFVYGEFKFGDAPIPEGQRKAIEHAVDSHNLAGHPSIAFHIVHHCKVDELIIAEEQIAVRRYYGDGWILMGENVKLKRAIKMWENYCRFGKGIIL